MEAALTLATYIVKVDADFLQADNRQHISWLLVALHSTKLSPDLPEPQPNKSALQHASCSFLASFGVASLSAQAAV